VVAADSVSGLPNLRRKPAAIGSPGVGSSSVQPPEVKAVQEELVNRHHDALNEDGRQRVYATLGNTLALIPDDAVWMVAESEPAVVVWVPEATLFMLSLTPTGAPILSSRALDRDTLIVSMEEGPRRSREGNMVVRKRFWEFRCLSEPASEQPLLSIVGEVWTGWAAGIDRCEAFAERLAAWAGWNIVEREDAQ
jgi:hypothetical protein